MDKDSLKTISKEDVVNIISMSSGQPKKVVRNILEDTLDLIVTAVNDGNDVRFYGFGTFSKKKRAARMSKSIQTGEYFSIPSRFVPCFKAGQVFKDRLMNHN